MFFQALHLLNSRDKVAIRRKQVSHIVFIALCHAHQINGDANIDLFFGICGNFLAAQFGEFSVNFSWDLGTRSFKNFFQLRNQRIAVGRYFISLDTPQRNMNLLRTEFSEKIFLSAHPLEIAGNLADVIPNPDQRSVQKKFFRNSPVVQSLTVNADFFQAVIPIATINK